MLKFPDKNDVEIRNLINAGQTLVVCLCAEWCNSCESWREQFAVLAEHYSDLCFVWLDIDKHPDMVAEVDLDVLPVLLIQTTYDIYFIGPIRPSEQVVITLLNSQHPLTSANDPGVREFLLESIV